MSEQKLEQIKEFVKNLPDEAIEAGVQAIEENVVGDQIVGLPSDVKILVEAVLRASCKVGHTYGLLQEHDSSNRPCSIEDRPQ